MKNSEKFAQRIKKLASFASSNFIYCVQINTVSILLFQMVHIFASETDHFPPIKALFELVTSVTLSIFQQGRGSSEGRDCGYCHMCLFKFLIIFDFTGSKTEDWNWEVFCKNKRKQKSFLKLCILGWYATTPYCNSTWIIMYSWISRQ